MSLPLNQVINGDCTEVMREWPENSVDLIVTDPPYGINFMGKEWDQALPPVEAFEQMIRVLKPGALAFVMSSPRQDVLWRMLSMLEGVGFNLRQSFLSHIYKTGFPKAYDVSKGIDKRPRSLELKANIGKIIKQHRLKKGLNLRQLGELCDEPLYKIGGTVFFETKSTKRIPTDKQWAKLKEVLEISDEYDELFEEAKREIIGKDGRTAKNSVFNLGIQEEWDITAPSTKLAEKWDGWKSQTGLKPAHEPILMVNKPFSESTIVDNVLKWGTGAINIDACRIPFQNQADVEQRQKNDMDSRPNKGQNYGRMGRIYDSGHGVSLPSFKSEGRFPANLLVSDSALDDGKVTKSGKIEAHHKIAKSEEGHSVKNVYGKYKHLPAEYQVFYGDEGSPYRFFDLDAWAVHHGFLDVAKPSKAERDFGLTIQPLQVPKSKFNLSDGSKDMRFDGVIPTPRRNIHPTVKPVKLMAYLIELGCPPKGIVVDPFLGSGTTCIAAKRLRRKWIGIEINPEYAEIAEARINIRGPLDQFMEAEK